MGRMNRVEGVAWSGADRGAAREDRGARARVPTELLLLAIAMAGESIGALTNPLAGAGLAIVAATLVTIRFMAAEVRAVRAWEAGAGAGAP
jgi:hypothetical protein